MSNFVPNEIKNPRVRIAPSPTGPLHIGTARTALFNYLVAKKYGGDFVLRIEDTDIERSEKKWEKNIIDGLVWLGLEYDEGPDKGGKYGPYRQSERLEVYSRYLKKLLDEKKAYYCFCSEEELEAERQYLMSIGKSPKYSGKCSHLSDKEVKNYLIAGKPSVIRFKVPSKIVKFKDLIRGELEFDSDLIGDVVIAKDPNTPLYNFAVVIDDAEMKITHVIRGEDHISNTPKQILLQEAMNLPRLEYAHLPLILGPDHSKLSKRHGATSLMDYQEAGYLPEALINFMAFLGWNPGGDKEIYTLSSIVKEFSLEKVQKGGAVFNIDKLLYLNGLYIRQKDVDSLTEACIPFLERANLVSKDGNGYKIAETGEKITSEWLKKIVSIYQGRMRKLSEIVQFADFFFKDILNYDKNILIWKNAPEKEIISSFNKLDEILVNLKPTDFEKEYLEKVLMPEAEEMGDRGKLLWPFRAALSGKEASAGPFEIAAILGKEKSLKRIRRAKEMLK